MLNSRRFQLAEIKDNQPWAIAVAEKIIATYPGTEVYTLASGISPSGVVHFGNFRDVMTNHLVREALQAKGKKVRFIFSWDNFDRLRKLPAGVPESFSEHLGKPLNKVPDPFGSLSSYAERFQQPFMEAMKRLEIEIEYKDQTELYERGVYDEKIKLALLHRKKIADILLSFMSEKGITAKGVEKNSYRENYYPISIYSQFTGKDSTKILSYDGDMKVTYLCLESGRTETVDLREKHIAKLNWKIDWPMRWAYESVQFEPGGSDHAAPGGSYEVSSVIAKEIFQIEPPIFLEYLFVGIKGLGSKMSGSKGNAVSPLDLLDIYEPKLLRWLYGRKDPNQSSELAFDSEIYRQYDEYDREQNNQRIIPFRQLVGLGQIVQWQAEKILAIVQELNLDYDQQSILERLPLAKNWLMKYNRSASIELRTEKNQTYWEDLPVARRLLDKRLLAELKEKEKLNISELDFI